MGEPFRLRVAALRAQWEERREVAGFAGRHDFASQFALLLTLHRWASQAIAAVVTVYGETLTITLSPGPDETTTPAFTLAIGEQFGAVATLVERRRSPAPQWGISVSVFSPQRDGAITTAGPERRAGQWSRSRIEELVLSLVGAYERSLGGAVPAGLDDGP